MNRLIQSLLSGLFMDEPGGNRAGNKGGRTMLKYIALMTMGVFGAASMAVAGTPITTITTTMPRLHRLERPVVHAKKPNLIPKVPRVGTNMRVHDQQ